MRKLILFLLSVILVNSCSSPSAKKEEKKISKDTSNVLFADSGYSSITVLMDSSGGEKRMTKIKSTRTYNVVNVKRGKEYISLLVTETSKQKTIDGGEGEDGSIELSGKISEGGNFNKEIWKKRVDANLVNYDWDYFEADNYGCCAAAEGKKIYRYADGEELLDFTSGLYEVEIPNTDISRYIGFKAINSANLFEGKTDSLLIGILTMIDPLSRSTQQLEVRAKNESVFKTCEMFSVSINFSVNNEKDKYNEDSGILQLWSADKIPDPEKLDGFAIELKIEADKVTIVKLPVKKGKLDIASVGSEMFDLVPVEQK